MRDELETGPVDRAIRAVAWLGAAGAAAYLALALFVDWAPVSDAFASLGWLALAVGALTASVNFLLRFARWHDLLKRMGQSVPAGANFGIYLGGLALTATPGKVGETVRSALLLRWRVPVGASLGAFLIDRLTDLIGVLLLAAITGHGLLWWALAAIAWGTGALLRHAFDTRHASGLVNWLDGRRRLASVVMLLRSGMKHYAAAWRMPALVLYVGLAALAYGLQGIVFAAYVDRLWPASDWRTSLHIFATSSLVGAASMIPGGLGAMEVASIAQLVAAGMPLAAATAATISLRIVTLWLALALGVISLLFVSRVASSPHAG